MPYLRFVLWFSTLPLVVLAVLVARRASRDPAANRAARRANPVIAVLTLLALLATVPWDYWLNRHGVWLYRRSLARVFRIPVEEYLWVVQQTLLVGWWTVLAATWPGGRRGRARTRGAGQAAHRTDTADTAGSSSPPGDRGAGTTMAAGGCTAGSGGSLRRLTATGWLLAAAAGLALAATTRRGFYLGTLFGWFAPALALQSGLGADVLRGQRWTRAAAVLTPTVLGCVADRLALGTGTFQVTGTYTVGVAILGLPLEEAAFFLLMDLLVVNGVLLATHPVMRRRLVSLAASRPAPGGRRPGRRLASGSER